MGKVDVINSDYQSQKDQGLLPSFQQLVETALEGVWVINQQSITTYVNASLCNLLGYQENEILLHPVSNFLFEEDLADHARRLIDRKNGKTDSYERRFKKKDGSSIWMLLSTKPIFDSNGEFAGSFVHLIDISDKKHRDRLIQLVTETQIDLAKVTEIDEVYDLIGRKIKEMIPEGIVGTTSVDENSQTISITNLFGIGTTYIDLVKKFHIDPTKIRYPLKDATLDELEIFTSGTLQIFRGGLYPLLMRKIPKNVCKLVEKQLHINQIQIIGLVSEGKHFGGVAVLSNGDISPFSNAIESIVFQATQVIKRLRSENFTALSDARLRSTFDAIADGYWDWDIPTGFVATNDKWFTMLGYQPNEFQTTFENFMNLVHPQDLEYTKRQIEYSLQNRDYQYNVEIRLRMKSGEYKYIQSRGKVITTAKGDKPLRMVGTHSDISERKQIEENRKLFYETQRKLLQVTTLKDLDSLVGNCLTKFVPNGYVILSRIDEQKRISKVEGIYGFKKM